MEYVISDFCFDSSIAIPPPHTPEMKARALMCSSVLPAKIKTSSGLGVTHTDHDPTGDPWEGGGISMKGKLCKVFYRNGLLQSVIAR